MSSLTQPKIKKSHIGIIVFILLVVIPLIIYLSLALTKKDDDDNFDWKLCKTLRKNADSCNSSQTYFSNIKYNTLYTISGISQSSNNSGTVVGWNGSVNGFLNKTDEPYDITTTDEINEGDTVVFQVPSDGKTNQGCTTNCGQYGCRVLVLSPDQAASWGHGGEYDNDGKKCKSINELTKVILKGGTKENEYVITDGQGIERTITISSV